MAKLKYAGICAAGFLLNCALVGIFFMLCFIPIFIIPLLYIFIEIQAVVTASALHGLFRKAISQKLKMKTVVYTIFANVLPHIISFILLLNVDSFTNGGYSGLAWVAIFLILSFEIFVSGIGGFLFYKNILRRI